jgi:Ni/Co efflux regulator RcnB
MKTLFATTAVIGLIAIAPLAWSQDDHHGGGGGDHPGGGGPAAHGGPAPGGGAAHGAGAGGHAGPAAVHMSPAGPGAGAPHGAAAHGPMGAAVTHTPDAHTTFAPHNGDPHEGAIHSAGPALHGGAPGHGRPADNFASLRRSVPAAQHFHAGAYRAPSGYRARRWNSGQRLPHSYFSRNYWITDYLLYSLLAPPPGLVWVRVGDDALLIDEYSGEVIQVEYGVFY